MAVGANPATCLRLVIRQTLTTATIGAGFALVVAPTPPRVAWGTSSSA
jgi:hypothetical protein